MKYVAAVSFITCTIMFGKIYFACNFYIIGKFLFIFTVNYDAEIAVLCFW